SLQAVSAERAFVDLRREALVIVLRNNERTRLHARAAADAAVLVEHHRAEIGLEHRIGRAGRCACWMLAVHAELTTEYPIRVGPGNDLVEGNERVIVGVEIARVLIAIAGEEFRLIFGAVVPRF